MKNQKLSEQCLSSQAVFSGKLLQVHRDEVLLPNGHRSVREYILHPGAVVMIPWVSPGRLILERQHRYPLHQEFLELPAGKLDPGEDPLSAGKRELLEETGYTAGQWNFLARIHPCIGYANEEMSLYMAHDLTQTYPRLDDDELIEVIEMDLEVALEGIRQGTITDAKTVIGLFWAEKWIREEWRLPGTD